MILIKNASSYYKEFLKKRTDNIKLNNYRIHSSKIIKNYIQEINIIQRTLHMRKWELKKIEVKSQEK